MDGSGDILLDERNYSIVKTAIFNKFRDKGEPDKVIFRAIYSEIYPNILIESIMKIDSLFAKENFCVRPRWKIGSISINHLSLPESLSGYELYYRCL